MSVDVGVVALSPFRLVYCGSGVLIDGFTGKFGDNLNLTEQFRKIGINRLCVTEDAPGKVAVLDQPVAVAHQAVEPREETGLNFVLGDMRRLAAITGFIEPFVFAVAPPDFLSVGLVAFIAAPDLFAEATATVRTDEPCRKYARAARGSAEAFASLNLKLNGVELVRLDYGGMAVLYIVLLNLPLFLSIFFVRKSVQ
ncbi:MAG: hypothetical protein FD169_1772 [Bacillota bacterium]|nr:MAG: hypothetical protein FD169_1772 [Bacillota bacterium]